MKLIFDFNQPTEIGDGWATAGFFLIMWFLSMCIYIAQRKEIKLKDNKILRLQGKKIPPKKKFIKLKRPSIFKRYKKFKMKLKKIREIWNA